MKSKLLVLVCIVFCSCSEPSKLIEVRIETVWTREQYQAHRSMSTTFPHVIVTRLDTGERVMILRDTWGKVGDTFKIDEKRIVKP